MGVKGGVYRILVAKPDGKRTIGTPRHIWEDNIKIFSGYGWGAWTGLMWLRIQTSGGLL